jgi:hypothetical protein
MKRLFEVVLVQHGKLWSLDPPKYFEKKIGPGGAKEFRHQGNVHLPKGQHLRIAFGPDHRRNGGIHEH